MPPRQGPFRLLLMLSSPIELEDQPDDSPMKSLDLAAEVEAREAGCPRKIVHGERLGVACVGEVLGSQQVAGGRDEGHGHKYRVRDRPWREPALRSVI